MAQGKRRIEREKRTLRAMAALYCAQKHDTRLRTRGLCGECRELFEYATQRLDRCPYGEGKPPCAKCPIHCYSAQMRERAKTVMRFSGPRMLWRHPFLALLHWIDGLRAGKTPARPGRRKS